MRYCFFEEINLILLEILNVYRQIAVIRLKSTLQVVLIRKQHNMVVSYSEVVTNCPFDTIIAVS